MNFRVKLIISITLLIAVTFGIGGTVLISASFAASLDEEKDAAMQSFETVQSTLYLLSALGEENTDTHLADVLEQMDQQGAAWQAVSLRDGSETIYGSGGASRLLQPLPQPEPGQCAYTISEDAYGYGLHIVSNLSTRERTLTLSARFDLSGAYSTRQTQQQIFAIIYIAVVFLGIGTSCILAVYLTRRLHRLTVTARRISGGDLSRRSQIKSHDEFGQLSRDFDAMADKLQENISRLEEDMQRQEAFMGAFAHEIKTPMTSIIGYADLLRQDILDQDGRIMAAGYIFSEGQRLEKLSFKLLDLLVMQSDTPVMSEVDLHGLLAEVENALAPVLKERGILLTCRGERGKVCVEPDLVKTLLYNLIDNAAKAMDGTGRIAVRGTVLPGGCEIRVTDNGRGMESGELTRITEAFYRVDKSRSRKQGGAGLGLTLCKQIVALHRGNLTFRSAPGVGTQVTAELYGKEVHDNAAD